MIKIKNYGVVQILRLIPKNIRINEVKDIQLEGIPLDIGKQRYKNFLMNGTVCKSCGLKGSFFTLEKQNEDSKKGVLNLYGIKEDKEIIISSVTNKRVGRFPIGTILCTDCQQTLVSHSKSRFKKINE